MGFTGNSTSVRQGLLGLLLIFGAGAAKKRFQKWRARRAEKREARERARNGQEGDE